MRWIERLAVKFERKNWEYKSTKLHKYVFLISNLHYKEHYISIHFIIRFWWNLRLKQNTSATPSKNEIKKMAHKIDSHYFKYSKLHLYICYLPVRFLFRFTFCWSFCTKFIKFSESPTILHIDCESRNDRLRKYAVKIKYILYHDCFWWRFCFLSFILKKSSSLNSYS